MNILVLNSGSSSLKFQVFDLPTGTVLAKGAADRIGGGGPGALQLSVGNAKHNEPGVFPNHETALVRLLTVLEQQCDHGLAIDAVGHRVVHGGELYRDTTLVDPGVIAGIRELEMLSPLHNPANRLGIEACQKLLPGIPQVACFDTAFHATVPEFRTRYPLPRRIYETYGIRRYGFHGISNQYVSGRLTEMTGLSRTVVCHIGNGASVTAVRDGQSVDTSMGFTPLEGLMMGTRCGSIDPAIPTFLIRQGLTPDQVDHLTNRESGVLGMSGLSADLRDVEGQAQAGDAACRMTLASYSEKIAKAIMSSMVSLEGAQAIVFTAGVGENSAEVRSMVLDMLAFFGIRYDKELNAGLRGKEAELSTPDSTLRVFVIPTNEELLIATETWRTAALAYKSYETLKKVAKSPGFSDSALG